MSLNLPISGALSEATPDSLNELFSRAPERNNEKDHCAIIDELRAQRERHKRAEDMGQRPRPVKLTQPTAKKPPLDIEGIEI